MSSRALAAYAGKKVLITGHTGFKGSWLTAWLLMAQAQVCGVSKGLPSKPAMFEILKLGSRMHHHIGDIRDLTMMKETVAQERPDFVIHLAAQAIVSRSYDDPIETVSTNTVGTLNLLEALRTVDWPCIAVLITSDKCYDNVEWVFGYRETDRLGGKDVYSGSKAAAELIIRSYLASFFPDDGPVRIGVARAGNVIGGGDWAKDRIVADCMRAWSGGRVVDIRNPHATRPWQHVLEPLSGYLALGAALKERALLHGEAFNFGPRAEQNYTVREVTAELAQGWDAGGPEAITRFTGSVPFHEASLLKLNCDKAQFHLRWEPTLSYQETIALVREWYFGFYRRGKDMYELTLEQIAQYEARARELGRAWAS